MSDSAEGNRARSPRLTRRDLLFIAGAGLVVAGTTKLLGDDDPYAQTILDAAHLPLGESSPTARLLPKRPMLVVQTSSPEASSFVDLNVRDIPSSRDRSRVTFVDMVAAAAGDARNSIKLRYGNRDVIDFDVHAAGTSQLEIKRPKTGFRFDASKILHPDPYASVVSKAVHGPTTDRGLRFMLAEHPEAQPIAAAFGSDGSLVGFWEFGSIDNAFDRIRIASETGTTAGGVASTGIIGVGIFEADADFVPSLHGPDGRWDPLEPDPDITQESRRLQKMNRGYDDLLLRQAPEITKDLLGG